MFDRDNNLVGEQIVNKIGSGGARITQVVDLNGSRSASQNAQPGPMGVPFEVN